MKRIAFILAVTLFAAAGCTTLRASQLSADLNVTADGQLNADIAVGEKISGQSTLTVLLGIIPLGGYNKFAEGVTYGSGGTLLGSFGLDPYGPAKAAAAYDAVSNSGADIIIAPKYVIEDADYLIVRIVSATVTGYKGTIRSIK